jgi:hypothetical protein
MVALYNTFAATARHAKLLIIIYLIIASPIESIRQILNAIFFLAKIRAVPL